MNAVRRIINLLHQALTHLGDLLSAPECATLGCGMIATHKGTRHDGQPVWRCEECWDHIAAWHNDITNHTAQVSEREWQSVMDFAAQPDYDEWAAELEDTMAVSFPDWRDALAAADQDAN